MAENPSLAEWLIQPDTLAFLASTSAIGAFLFLAFPDRYANGSLKMPWMPKPTPTSYRQMGFVYAVLCVVCTLGWLIQYLSKI
jgi:hypothetical protein